MENENSSGTSSCSSSDWFEEGNSSNDENLKNSPNSSDVDYEKSSGDDSHNEHKDGNNSEQRHLALRTSRKAIMIREYISERKSHCAEFAQRFINISKTQNEKMVDSSCDQNRRLVFNSNMEIRQNIHVPKYPNEQNIPNIKNAFFSEIIF